MKYLTRRDFLKFSGSVIALSFYFTEDLYGNNIKIPVLLYHDISCCFRDEYTVSPVFFAAQMEWLYSQGYVTLSMRELNSTTTINNQKIVVLTFDDGYASFTDYVFPLLIEYNFKATLNIIGQHVGTYINLNGNRPMLSWDEYRHIMKSGLVDLGCHTYALHSRAGILSSSKDAVEKDLLLFQEIMLKEIGAKTNILAWPYGIYDERSINVVTEAGFKYILTSHEGYFGKGSDLRKIPRLNINNKLDLLSFQQYIGGKT